MTLETLIEYVQTDEILSEAFDPEAIFRSQELQITRFG